MDKCYSQDIRCPESDNEPSLFAFSLSDRQGREAFLVELNWLGEPSLFQAVAHVWDSLAEPRKDRCTLMGQLSSAGGAGKQALRRTLQQFLLDGMKLHESFPSRDDYLSIDEWHEAVIGSFAILDEGLFALAANYALILDGQQPQPNLHLATI